MCLCFSSISSWLCFWRGDELSARICSGLPRRIIVAPLHKTFNKMQIGCLVSVLNQTIFPNKGSDFVNSKNMVRASFLVEEYINLRDCVF